MTIRKIALSAVGFSLALAVALFLHSSRLAAADPTPAGAAAPPATASPPKAANPNTEEKIVEVVVEGNHRVDTNRILAQMKLRAGSIYSNVAANEDYRRIFTLREFDNVVIQREPIPGGVRLRVTVTEVPLVQKIEFVGAKNIKEKDLLKLTDLSEKMPLDHQKLYRAQELIVDEYKGKGYYFASATLDKPLLEKSYIARYTIAEGPKVIIRKVSFSGNDSLSSGDLNDQVETKERFWPFVSGAYSEQTLDDDVEKIKAYYVGQGFLDVQARRKVEFSDNQEKAFVEFVIKEGQRYHVASVAIRGAKTLSSAYLSEHFKLQPGAAYTADALKADKKFIVDSYGKIGYVHALADPKMEYTTEPGKVDLVFDVVEGPKITLGEITITGNKVTQDKVILRALSFQPEEVANSTAIKNAQDRLMQSQLFNSVDISLIPTEDPAVENVLVNLEEKETAQLIFSGAGVSSNSGVIGNVSLVQKNFDWSRLPKGPNDTGAFRGAGETMRLSLSPGTETQEYSLGFTEPSFFDRDVRFDTSGSYFKRKRESYDEGRLGGQASVGKSLWKDIYGSVGLRMEQIDISNLAWDAPKDVRDVQGTSYLSTVNAKLERDKTDNYFVPTTGDRESVAVEQAGVLGGDYTFTKFLIDGKRWWTVTEDLEGRRSFFSLRSRAGFTPSDTPIFERFYAGGQGSIRGFKYRGVGPRADDSNNTPLGGDFLFLATGEYEYPIYGKNVSGVFFLDSGTVQPDISMGEYRVAAGFGFRFTIPLLGAPIPFALDFGFPLSKTDQDETQIFSFSMAFNF